MKVDTIQEWASESRRRDENGNRVSSKGWNCLVSLIRDIWVSGDLPQKLSFSVLVALPKPDGGTRGIGLLEVIWNIISSIINRRINNNVLFRDELHGFLKGRGTGTATLELKLAIQAAMLQNKAWTEIFLDLSKAYDHLDRDRTLAILECYGVGNNTLRLLRCFWSGLTLVPKQSGYYGSPIDSACGVTQGDIVSPTIFNIVVDAILWEWHRRMGQGTDVLSAFYADDGRIGGFVGDRLQIGLANLVQLFSYVGLKLNVTKTKTVAFVPPPPHQRESTPAYKRRLTDTGEGDSFSNRKRQMTVCPHCDKSMQFRSLNRHIESQHGVCVVSEGLRSMREPNHLPAPRQLMDMHPYVFVPELPSDDSALRCPVEGCPFQCHQLTKLRYHFRARHPKVTLRVAGHRLERCPDCDLYCSPIETRNPESRHRRSFSCRQFATRKRRRELEEENKKAVRRTYRVGDSVLEQLDVFKYLGNMVTADDSDMLAVRANIAKARRRWFQISRLLVRDGATPKVTGMFYKVTVMSVLLFGSEVWVMNPAILGALDAFYRKALRQICGRSARYDRETGEWEWPSFEDCYDIGKVHPISTYVERPDFEPSGHMGCHRMPLRCDEKGSSVAPIFRFFQHALAMRRKRI